jgi:ADP-ribose pyrophosphatase YjhB (NUDIX family)/ribosomal protein S18 acetylase RimI-like enzyme
MRVVQAQLDDLPAWLVLARDVEDYFGYPLADAPGYQESVRKNMQRGTAFCVREENAAPGAPLIGGLLLAPRTMKYELSWLAVSPRWRRCGVASTLVQHMLSQIAPPAEVVLITFAEEVARSAPARAFYRQHGFAPAEPGPANAAGLPTQIFRRVLGETPTVRAVLHLGANILLVQHHYHDPANTGKWSLPGGQIDPGDPDRVATLRREMREEFHVEVTVERFLGTFADAQRLHYVYLAAPHEIELHLDPSEIAAAQWYTPDEIDALHDADALLAPFIYDAVRAVRQTVIQY